MILWSQAPILALAVATTLALAVAGGSRMQAKRLAASIAAAALGALALALHGGGEGVVLALWGVAFAAGCLGAGILVRIREDWGSLDAAAARGAAEMERTP